MTVRRYSELRRLATFKERYDYLVLRGRVGVPTFGYDRWINQRFYRSREWRDVRYHVIARDLGCDLGVAGYDIHDRLHIHHMNPMRVCDVVEGDLQIIEPEFLITTTHSTHNAIHYGDEKLLIARHYVERKPGDTALW